MQRERFLISEIERGLYERSYAWEGKPEQAFDFGEVVIHTQPQYAVASCRSFAPEHTDQRLDEIIEQVERLTRRCLWVIGPNTQPADLEERLIERGFLRNQELKGLILEDLVIDTVPDPEIAIESRSCENAEDYARLCSQSNNPQAQAEQLDYVHRYLQLPYQEMLIFLARLKGQAVGYAFLRLEANGTANLCEAYTPSRGAQARRLSCPGSASHRLWSSAW